MNDRELLEYIAAQVGKLTGDVSNITKRLDSIEIKQDSLQKGQDGLLQRMDSIEGIVLNIEQNHGQKLDALFDGYKQTYEKLLEHDRRFDSVDGKLDSLSLKVNSHNSKLEVLEGGKKKSF